MTPLRESPRGWLGTGAGGERRSGSRHYSHFVSAMKIALPLVALGLMVTVLVWPALETRQDAAVNYSDLSLKAEGLEMLRPHLAGVDDKGRPYEVRAEKALADGLEPKLITLQSPEADLTLEDGRAAHVQANQGSYRPVAKTLSLRGAVRLRTGDGYVANSEAFDIDLAAGVASSDGAVSAAGPAGGIDAHHLNASDNGRVLRFGGGVTVVINPKTDNRAGPAPPAAPSGVAK